MKHRFHIALSTLTATVLTALSVGVVSSCNETFIDEGQQRQEAIYMSTSVQISHNTRGSINTGDIDNKVKSIRLLIFDTATGSVLHNVRHNVSEFTNQMVGVGAVWHDPFKITPGQRDFFFVANEDSWPGLATALAGVANRSELYTNTAFTQLAYEPDYKPTDDRPLLMTQAYFGKNIQSTRNGKGTQADPQHFEAEGDEEVELIRTLAKVQLTVKKIAHVEEQGGQFKATKLKFRNFNNFKALKLIQVPKYFSLFANPYFNSETHLPGKKTTADFYGTTTPGTETKVIEANAATTVSGNENNYVQKSVNDATSQTEVGSTSYTTPVTQYYDYTTTVYVPEFLRPIGSTTDEVPGKDHSDRAMSFGFYSDADNLVYKTSIDHGANQATFDWLATAQATSPTTKFVLPNAATTYSRYSVVRNNFYQLTAEEAYPQLRLQFKVMPWEDHFLHVYVGSYFNVYVEDPAFPGATSKVRIITSEPTGVPADFKVRVKRVGTAEEIVHTNTEHQSYTEHTFNLGGVPNAGDGVFEIYYKDELVKTIKKP